MIAAEIKTLRSSRRFALFPKLALVFVMVWLFVVESLSVYLIIVLYRF